jgi:exo-rhamnogalacturonan lyase-like protein
MPRLFTAAILSLLASSALAAEIKIHIDEPIGAARRGEVVSGGIPMPAGKYKADAKFRLFDGATQVPVQVSPIVKYPDGSLHWALVSFPASLAAKGKKTLRLVPGAASSKPTNPVMVKETGDVVEVSNGLVAFKINKANFNGFESISYRGKAVFKAAKAGLVTGGKGGAGKPTHFAYYYRGPVRTTLYLKGTFGAAKTPTWAMSITLNAGESAIRVVHDLRNGSKGAKGASTTSPQLCLGLEGSLTAGKSGNSGKGAAFGWQEFSGGADLLVFMRSAGRNNKGQYKAAVAGKELRLDLTSGGADVSMAYGEHRSMEIDLVFGKTQTAAALSEPLHARAPSAWYSAHDGMGAGRGFGSVEDETKTYQALKLKGAGTPGKMPNEKPNPNLYRAWFDAHRTSECDQIRGLTLGYVRSGQRGFLDRAAAWARYWRTFLLYRSDEWTYGKDGRYRTPKWGSGRVCSEGCHFYVVGLFNYALLTGDLHALEGAFDGAEFANVCWYGQYSGKKPGSRISTYGSRGFARCYVVVARAYDVARNDQWRKALLHYVNVATQTPERDSRGFTLFGSFTNAGRAKGAAKRSGPAAMKIFADEKVEIVGKDCKHPKYGQWRPKCISSWPEAIESIANYSAWEALRDSKGPAAQVAAEDAKDYAVAQAYLGQKYLFHPVQKIVSSYPYMDFPLPGMVPNMNGGKWKKHIPGTGDSWYTKWWPDVLARGYKLTGDPGLRATSLEILWWGMARVYKHRPNVKRDECPRYAWVHTNTKGDWISPTAVTFGVGASQRRDAAAPKPVSDLAAKSLGGGKVELTWSAPADVGGGKVVLYQVKHAPKPIKDYLEIKHLEEFRKVIYWNMAKNVAGEPVPGAAGTKEKLTVTVKPGKRYFVLRSEDAEINRSKLSNTVTVDVK